MTASNGGFSQFLKSLCVKVFRNADLVCYGFAVYISWPLGPSYVNEGQITHLRMGVSTVGFALLFAVSTCGVIVRGVIAKFQAILQELSDRIPKQRAATELEEHRRRYTMWIAKLFVLGVVTTFFIPSFFVSWYLATKYIDEGGITSLRVAVASLSFGLFLSTIKGFLDLWSIVELVQVRLAELSQRMRPPPAEAVQHPSFESTSHGSSE